MSWMSGQIDVLCLNIEEKSKDATKKYNVDNLSLFINTRPVTIDQWRVAATSGQVIFWIACPDWPVTF